MSTPVSVLSTSTVQLPQPFERSRRELEALDLLFLSDGYIQKGLLYPKASIAFDDVIQRLQVSLSNCLLYFYPLAGRLSADQQTTIFIDCNNEGAQFVVAACDCMSVSGLISDGDVPVAARSFYPLDGAINYDGHSLPLLAVQVTELADGIFIGCSFNHSIGDGTSFWHFMNSWSELSRGKTHISRQPIIQHTREPFNFVPSEEALARNKWPVGLREQIFRFSRNDLGHLKAKANQQCKMEKGEISSLQAVVALIWRAVTRARTAAAGETTTCWIVTGDRHRCNPPLPPEYLGNCLGLVCAKSLVGELLSHDLGWAARALHEKVSSYTTDAMRALVEEWMRNPSQTAVQLFKGNIIFVGSSPRFEMYGNDFGWGRPVGVFSGPASKFDGKVNASQGREGFGSIELEVCLSPETMNALVLDEELKEALISR